jgi:hypothetical protein
MRIIGQTNGELALFSPATGSRLISVLMIERILLALQATHTLAYRH